MGFKKVEGKRYDDAKSVKAWQKGEVVTGYYLGILAERTTTFNGQSYQSKIHGLRASGNEFPIWGCSSLDYLLSAVPDGCMIRITYQGTKKFKNGTGHHFEVELDLEDRIPVDAKQIETSRKEVPKDEFDDIDWGDE